MTALTITVQGSATIRRAPERGTAHLTLGFDGADRAEVLERTRVLHTEVSTDLTGRRDDPAGSIESWSAGQVQVWGQRPWNAQGEQLDVVYTSAASVTATFHDFARLSAWIDQISARDGVTVQNITWDLTEDLRSEVETEALRSAIADAVRKAEVYAHSLGLRTVTAISISDPGLLANEPSPQPYGDAIAGSPRMMKASASSSGISLQPEDIVFDVHVHARFTAS
ncbi:SIMPL domain-containing protein [Plantibacter sp. Mn2098]|uniref:SIMPL domain-containing protein n=1 Tax=Plantibacter sp. Mn2098 TaxID=3395266 RepID=UPI003BE73261